VALRVSCPWPMGSTQRDIPAEGRRMGTLAMTPTGRRPYWSAIIFNRRIGASRDSPQTKRRAHGAAIAAKFRGRDSGPSGRAEASETHGSRMVNQSQSVFYPQFNGRLWRAWMELFRGDYRCANCHREFAAASMANQTRLRPAPISESTAYSARDNQIESESNFFISLTPLRKR
jgi:hypothetical protein